MGLMISGFGDTTVLSMIPISEAITALSIIKCDVCKKSVASYDVFMKGTPDFPFLKRCCENCAKQLNATQEPA